MSGPVAAVGGRPVFPLRLKVSRARSDRETSPPPRGDLALLQWNLAVASLRSQTDDFYVVGRNLATATYNRPVVSGQRRRKLQTSCCIAAVSNPGCLHAGLKSTNINNEHVGDQKAGGGRSLTLRLFLSASQKQGLGATAATLHIWGINPDVSLIFMMDVNRGSSRLVRFVFSMRLKAFVFFWININTD